jgi:hypothetical protein
VNICDDHSSLLRRISALVNDVSCEIYPGMDPWHIRWLDSKAIGRRAIDIATMLCTETSLLLGTNVESMSLRANWFSMPALLSQIDLTSVTYVRWRVKSVSAVCKRSDACVLDSINPDEVNILQMVRRVKLSRASKSCQFSITGKDQNTKQQSLKLLLLIYWKNNAYKSHEITWSSDSGRTAHRCT